MEDCLDGCHQAKPDQERDVGAKTVIEISELEFQFPHSDFRLGVKSLNVLTGERVAIIGPSGSGKTTLLHLIAGILTPGRGTIQVNGERISAMHDAARRAFRVSQIGLVFQSFELLSYLDVFENILLPYRLNPALKLTADVAKRAEKLAEETGITHRLRYLPHRLSQGERQRVAICRAMLPEPPVLLADEPTGNLDPSAKQHAVDLLFKMNATLLMVTHDTEIAGRFQRVIDCREFRR
jgi:ABC-type lipoprotein export system ATPase subunit